MLFPVHIGKKGRNINLSDSSNYRAIALSSIYGKTFDHIILSRYADKLCTSDLPFGFKRQHSTNMCTMVLKEAISYYVNNGSSVFCTLLDATKAFDRVEYVKLFKLLMGRDISSVSRRLLLNMYTCHGKRIAWNGVCSDSFFVLNGVKQGDVFSTVLFCIYLDGLLCSLAESNVGCYICYVFVGALAYADDIVLLAPSTRAMRLMLGVCGDFAEEYAIVFNAKKSKCLWVQHRSASKLESDGNPQFVTGDSAIEYVDSWSHLGHIIAFIMWSDGKRTFPPDI